MRNNNITGVVLAGGMSRRLGRNKALEIIDGQPMITGVIEKIQKITSSIIVVVNDVERGRLLPISEEISIVADVFPDKGSLGGIYTGLISSSTKWTIVVACDMPFINLGLMRHMISQTPNHDVVIPVTSGRPETMHALYSKKCTAYNMNFFSDKVSFPIKLQAKIRYNSKSSLATINKTKTELEVNFETPQLAITSGQSIVFYEDDLLIGGAIIK